eukprot:6106830-Alexandrium_andersonii.AAC.1
MLRRVAESSARPPKPLQAPRRKHPPTPAQGISRQPARRRQAEQQARRASSDTGAETAHARECRKSRRKRARHNARAAGQEQQGLQTGSIRR